MKIRNLAVFSFVCTVVVVTGSDVEAKRTAAQRDAAWAANVWLNPQRIPITSIGDGVKQLKAIQRNWAT